MGVRFPSVFTPGTGIVYGAAGAEVITMTTPPLTLPLDSAQVMLFWYMAFNVGTGTTGVTVRLRRGALITSPIINISLASAVTAAVFNTLSGCYVDTPGAVGGQQYSLTVAGTGTTGAGSSGDSFLIAFAL